MVTIKVVTKPCALCYQTSIMEVDEGAYSQFANGMFAQDAFPNMPIDQREMLITGTHPECWNKMFPDEEEY